MAHAHEHSHPHHHDLSLGRIRALWWAFLINAVFLVVEVIGGILSGSLALLADAGHMLTDVGALGVALLVAHVSRRPASPRRTFGYGRAEVLSGLLNGLTLWLVVGVIAYEAVRRMMHPPEVDVSIMLAVAVAGLLANVASAAVLYSHRKADLNVKGAFLHLAADSAGSVGVIAAGVAIALGGWFIVDPIVSLLLGLLILWSSWGLVKESAHILLEGAPAGLNLADVRRELEALEGVCGCHDLHAWLIGSGEPLLTAHLLIEAEADPIGVLEAARETASSRFGIEHVTFQVEHERCLDLHP